MQNAHVYLAFGLNKMAKIMKRKPKNEIIGPTVIRRTLKMSGLNWAVVVEPVIKIKPSTIIAKPTAIKIILILPSVKRLFSSIMLFVFLLIGKI